MITEKVWYTIDGQGGQTLHQSEYPLSFLVDGKEFDLEKYKKAIIQLTSDSIYGRYAPYTIVKHTKITITETIE